MIWKKEDAFNPMRWKKHFDGWGRKKQEKFLSQMTPKAALALRYCSEFWLRDKQLVPDSDWMFWLIKAGRGFGKSRAGACWIKACIANHQPIGGRHDLYAMVGPTHPDVVKVMVPALLNEYSPSDRKKIQWNKTEGTLTFPNGAILYCYSSETEIRGPNISKCWCDELAKWWSADEQFDTLRYAVRIGKPQILITTTPKKSIRTIKYVINKSLEEPDKYVVVHGSAYENTALPETYRQQLDSMAGTRKYRQEALGELLDDTEDSLWPESVITEHRVISDPQAPLGLNSKQKLNLPLDVQLIRIVVSVDPAGTANPDSDETGITVCGLADTGHAYVLEDASGRYSPNQWATKAVQLYHDYGANAIIAEKNFGGDMVEHTIKTVDRDVHVKVMKATHGKLLRAEPVAAKYAQGLVHHVGAAKRFDRLEDQMTVFTGAPSTNKRKDDRLDSLVWGLTELLIRPVIVYRSLGNLPFFG